jgi:prepilin-type N-terminal cleavage/methylation domain-containing protein
MSMHDGIGFVRASRARTRAGVTLAEILVATSILAIIAMLSSEIIANVSRLWLAGRGKSETFATARALLNRLRTDLDCGVFRADVPGFANPRWNADPDRRLGFCARVQAPKAGSTSGTTSRYRKLTYVTYRLESGGRDAGYVVREDRPYDWNDSPFGDVGQSTSVDRRLCGNILGFRPRFVLSKGSEVETLETNSVSAVSVSLAVADQATFRLLESAGLLAQAMQRFKSLKPEEWEKELVAADSTLPKVARQGVRIFHQAVPVTISRVEGR